MPSLYSVLYVALGGALGSVSRYLLGTWTQTASKSIDFPYGTLTVNLLGCFLIGFSPNWRRRAAPSLLRQGHWSSSESSADSQPSPPSATTPSTFCETDKTFNALANVGANVILGLFLVWLGRAAAYWIWK
jgi:fluoride exporter